MLPVQITIRDMPISSVLEDHVRKKAMKLNQFYQRINSIRIVIQVPQKHKHQGKLYSVNIDLTVPGKELVVNRKMHQDVYVAVRDAFAALTRQLENYARKRRGEIKVHESPTQGYIRKILYDKGYGFISGMDGTEYYFGATNVCSPDFLQLQAGDSVQFIIDVARDGFQAHRVTREKNGYT